MIDPAELPGHIRAEYEAGRVTGPQETAGRAAAEAELARLKARFTELQEAELAAYPARYLVGTGDAALETARARMGTNEVESAEAAANRFAGELQRLRDGLVGASINISQDRYAVEGGVVDAALHTISTLMVTNADYAERIDHGGWEKLTAKVIRAQAECQQAHQRADSLQASLTQAQRDLDKANSAHVCTDRCRPNSHVAFTGRRRVQDLTAERDQLREQILNAPVSRVDVFGDAWPVDRALWPSNGLGIPAAVAAITARHGNDSVVALVDLAEVAKAIEGRGALTVAGVQDEGVAQEWVSTPAEQHEREQAVITAARAWCGLFTADAPGTMHGHVGALRAAVDQLGGTDGR